MPNSQHEFASTELFRYVKLRPPVVLDTARRARSVDEVQAVLSQSDAEQVQWARQLLDSSTAVRGIGDLSVAYLEALSIDTLPARAMPSKSDVKDVDAFLAQAERVEDRNGDQRRLIQTLVAHQILGNREQATEIGHLLDFVEHYPSLMRVSTGRRFATIISDGKKLQPKRLVPVRPTAPSDKAAPDDDSHDQKDAAEQQEPAPQDAEAIKTLWLARSAEIQDRRRKMTNERQKLLRRTPGPAPLRGSEGSATRERAMTAYAEHYRKQVRERRESVEALRREYQDLVSGQGLRAEFDAKVDDEVYVRAVGVDKAALVRMQEAVAARGVTVGKAGFCHAYEEAVRVDDESGGESEVPEALDCFDTSPQVTFGDEIQILGTADLIRVDETFVKYVPGEISYIENILPGEHRRRRIRSLRYDEQGSEVVEDESSELTTEVSATSSHELSNEIKTELNTRFDTDVNAAVNASGGGTIGVVDVEGGASLSAGFGAGVDSSFSTASESEFSQEIINKAVEQTRKRVMEKRVRKSFSQHETTNLHAIINDSADARNGIYCLLDKQVCISETIYGKRLFLLSSITLPGRSLLCQRRLERFVELQTAGERPEFDISPSDIHPSTYMEYVARYRASDVEPPPAPTVTLSRVYKTDTTNESVQTGGSTSQKIASLLVPYFQRYKRFLINDNVRLPDGYQVQDVWVTVNHGANGVSIPAHLPLSLGGAALLFAPLLMPGVLNPLFLPFVMWEIGYLASPLLHYNAESSNVSATVGVESQDSPYYFFAPDVLIQEIFDLLGSFSLMSPEIIDGIQEAADEVFELIGDAVEDVSGEVGNVVQTTVTDVIDAVKKVFEAVIAALNVVDGGDPTQEIQAIWDSLGELSATVDISALTDEVGALFSPLQTFINQVITTMQGAVASTFTDLFSWLDSIFQGSDILVFTGAHGLKGELPVSFNAIAINPGVTVNMNVCMTRTKEALDKWRLETFGRLHQAYLQQLAEYDSRAYLTGQQQGLSRSPGTLRREEANAVKERILHILNNAWDNNQANYDLNRITLFESAIDWNNMSVRLYNYGPDTDYVMHHKNGVFAGVDDRRRAFLSAPWAHVLLPLIPNDHLEEQLVQYMRTGVFDLQGDLSDDELTQLYQDLILERRTGATGVPGEHRLEILPTDLLVLNTDSLQSQLPSNPNTPCSEL